MVVVDVVVVDVLLVDGADEDEVVEATATGTDAAGARAVPSRARTRTAAPVTRMAAATPIVLESEGDTDEEMLLVKPVYHPFSRQLGPYVGPTT